MALELGDHHRMEQEVGLGYHLHIVPTLRPREKCSRCAPPPVLMGLDGCRVGDSSLLDVVHQPAVEDMCSGEPPPPSPCCSTFLSLIRERLCN